MDKRSFENDDVAKEDVGWLYDFLERLAEGIVAVVGPHCEVVVHDFRDLEHSVVAIAGNLTGRRPGAPIPDLNMIEDKFSGDLPDEINYRSLSSRRDFQSSTVWFRDKEGNAVGAVCINVDYSSMLRANEILEALVAPVRMGARVVVEDTFAKDLEDLIEVAVAQYLRQESIPSLEDMNRADKQGLIRTLEARGLFRIRGAVDQLVDLLDVSRATIYNYRSNVSSDEED